MLLFSSLAQRIRRGFPTRCETNSSSLSCRLSFCLVCLFLGDFFLQSHILTYQETKKVSKPASRHQKSVGIRENLGPAALQGFFRTRHCLCSWPRLRSGFCGAKSAVFVILSAKQHKTLASHKICTSHFYFCNPKKQAIIQVAVFKMIDKLLLCLSQVNILPFCPDVFRCCIIHLICS